MEKLNDEELRARRVALIRWGVPDAFIDDIAHRSIYPSFATHIAAALVLMAPFLAIFSFKWREIFLSVIKPPLMMVYWGVAPDANLLVPSSIFYLAAYGLVIWVTMFLCMLICMGTARVPPSPESHLISRLLILQTATASVGMKPVMKPHKLRLATTETQYLRIIWGDTLRPIFVIFFVILIGLLMIWGASRQDYWVFINNRIEQHSSSGVVVYPMSNATGVTLGCDTQKGRKGRTHHYLVYQVEFPDASFNLMDSANMVRGLDTEGVMDVILILRDQHRLSGGAERQTTIDQRCLKVWEERIGPDRLTRFLTVS